MSTLWTLINTFVVSLLLLLLKICLRSMVQESMTTTCSPARTGRHRQRYMDQFRLVAGCIPFRIEKVVQDSICNSEKKLHVLMISSPNREDLVFPKGGWEDDETITEAVCREALEEAGVKGILGEKPLGVWEFRSKSRQKSCSAGGGCRGYMYGMEVTEELDSWPEQAIYHRKWLTVDDAFKFCRYDWMREALRRLVAVLSEDRKEEAREEELVEFDTNKLSIPDSIASDRMHSPASACIGKPASGVLLLRLDESCGKCAVQG